MEIGVNGQILENAANLVEEERKNEQDYVIIQNQLTEGNCVKDPLIRKENATL